MANLTIEVKTTKTIWFYILNLLTAINWVSLIPYLSNKKLLKMTWPNGDCDYVSFGEISIEKTINIETK